MVVNPRFTYLVENKLSWQRHGWSEMSGGAGRAMEMSLVKWSSDSVAKSLILLRFWAKPANAVIYICFFNFLSVNDAVVTNFL